MLGGCVFITAEDQRARIDQDGDGVGILDDCDDTRASMYPGAVEVCDGLDNNCDGAVDEDLYPDLDGDGFGGQASGPCQVDWQPVAGDCDDTDPMVSPGQPEWCNGRNDGCTDTWGPEAELGVVTWTAADGTLHDRTAAFAAGTADAPARIELDPTGTLTICRSADPYRVRLSQGSVGSLEVVGHSIALPTDSDTASAVPVLNGLSSSDPGPTLLFSGDGTGRIELSNLHVTGGFTTPTLPGGGLHLSRFAAAHLSHVTLTGNQALVGSAGGAGLYAGNIPDLQLSSVTLAENTGGDGITGGGALIENSHTRLFDVDVVDNRAAMGGGIAFFGSSYRLDARSSQLTGNWGNRLGGGLYVGPGSRVFLVGTPVTENHADWGAGAYTEGQLSCFGDDDDLPSPWSDNFADTCGATATIVGLGAMSFDGCTADRAEVASGTTQSLCMDGPDLARLESPSSSAVLVNRITGQWFYCAWSLCNGDVALVE